jgi:SAM-dependent methyltransferase
LHEILENSRPGQRILDLGSRTGSFPAGFGPFIAIRADLDHPSRPTPNFAQADAAHLPFADRAFDAVISNHSLEHFEDLAGSLHEIGRVLKPTGRLYIAVPDASTFCDRLYRWLARGGGHVNPFVSSEKLAATIAHTTHLPHVQTRTLFTSLSYMHRGNPAASGPRRHLLVGGGFPITLHLFLFFARLSDRILPTRLGVYGWALYFGSFAVPIDPAVWSNVCIRCGSGAQSDWLRHIHAVRRRFFIPVFRCPNCGTTNVFTEDRHYVRFSGLASGSPPNRGL